VPGRLLYFADEGMGLLKGDMALLDVLITELESRPQRPYALLVASATRR